MIRLKDAEKTYENGTKAVRGISFQIDDGEFVFLVGPSGSGKSTIIKMLTGEIVPTGGRVMVNHRPCEKADKVVEAGDVLTCRGLGKCVLTEIGGTSKRGRTILTIQRYL